MSCRLDEAGGIQMSVRDKTNPLTGGRRLKRADLNKGTAFSETEREEYGLRGLLPAQVSTLEEQEA